jgi:hypothetical protein
MALNNADPPPCLIAYHLVSLFFKMCKAHFYQEKKSITRYTLGETPKCKDTSNKHDQQRKNTTTSDITNKEYKHLTMILETT